MVVFWIGDFWMLLSEDRLGGSEALGLTAGGPIGEHLDDFRVLRSD